MPIEHLAKIFWDRQNFVTLTELVGASNSALGSRVTLEGYGTSRAMYTMFVMEWR